jgi:hypothetical protein
LSGDQLRPDACSFCAEFNDDLGSLSWLAMCKDEFGLRNFVEWGTDGRGDRRVVWASFSDSGANEGREGERAAGDVFER